jgi:hypothetical protein
MVAGQTELRDSVVTSRDLPIINAAARVGIRSKGWRRARHKMPLLKMIMDLEDTVKRLT